MERVPMTIEGYKNLETELQRLKAVERPRIIAAISEARARSVDSLVIVSVMVSSRRVAVWRGCRRPMVRAFRFG